MKAKITTLLAIALLMGTGPVLADQYVRGYTRSDGTYVAPHYRSEPNQYKFDNYSSQGRSNPYTGERGYQRNEYSNPPSYNRSSPYGSSSGYDQRRNR